MNDTEATAHRQRLNEMNIKLGRVRWNDYGGPLGRAMTEFIRGLENEERDALAIEYLCEKIQALNTNT